MTDKEICIEFIDEKPIGAVGERFNYDYHDEKIIDNQTGKTYDEDNYHMLVIDGLLNQLNNENEQLKERNQRQAKRLAELYELMVKKDWESLTEIIDDFCSCEEQLQREWRTY